VADHITAVDQVIITMVVDPILLHAVVAHITVAVLDLTQQ
jgi:hypothetical protein